MIREGTDILCRLLGPQPVLPMQHVQCLTTLTQTPDWMSGMRRMGVIVAMPWQCCMTAHTRREAVRPPSYRLLQSGLLCLQMWKTQVMWRSHIGPLWHAAHNIVASPLSESRQSSVGPSSWTVHWDLMPSHWRMSIMTGRPGTLVPGCHDGLHHLRRKWHGAVIFLTALEVEAQCKPHGTPQSWFDHEVATLLCLSVGKPSVGQLSACSTVNGAAHTHLLGRLVGCQPYHRHRTSLKWCAR